LSMTSAIGRVGFGFRKGLGPGERSWVKVVGESVTG
jgi:hypothetical protein